MKSTYYIEITSLDSFGRSHLYKDASVADMVQLLNQIAGLGKSGWNVNIKKGLECPYQVNIDIECKCNTNWIQYTIRIEDGEAHE